MPSGVYKRKDGTPRGVPQNLIDNSKLTPEERRASASRAAKASVLARRKKRDMQETARMFLQLAATDRVDEYLKSLGVQEKDRTNMMGIMARMILKAQGGDVKAAEFVRDTAGYGVQRIELEASVGIVQLINDLPSSNDVIEIDPDLIAEESES